MAPFKYRAFISYSHADRRWAEWLHKALETYRVPSRLVGRETTAGVIPRSLAPIFRDRDELPSAHDLTGKVQEALARSANLIVICSPHSAGSRWVEAEIRAFQQLGRADRVFCLIVEGEPHACFAPVLRGADGEEPIAADVRPGGDGKTNAKLKLVAGLLDVGFDDLRRREAQRAHRRMAVIAGLAVIGMVVTSSLAFIAYRARNEAQFQRAQAEQLIGFMLGNLRDKLEPAGRLDILDDVANHAMGYFEAQRGDAGTRDTRAKRADALLMIGRVRFDQGHLDEADKAFEQSLATSRDLVEENAADRSSSVAMADAYLWLGRSDWQRGDLDKALAHFKAAQPLYRAVLDATHDNPEWLAHAGWLQNNLGHVQEARGALPEALRQYRAYLAVSRELSARQPGQAKPRQQLAEAHDNLGQLLYSMGDLAGAEREYQAECAILRTMLQQDRRNDAAKVNLADAEVFLANVAESRGQVDIARDLLQHATQMGEALLASDPTNVDHFGDTASYHRRMARNMRLRGEQAAAGPALQRADALYARMLALSPDSARARFGRAATMLEQANVAWQAGDASAARARAQQAISAYAALLHDQGDDRRAALGLAGAELVLGKTAIREDAPEEARRHWARALEALRPFEAGARDPGQLALQAELLHLLDRNDDAGRLTARLAAMGYRDPDFLAWTEKAHAQGVAAKGSVAQRSN